MSGIDKTLTLGLGIGSSIFAVWIVRRMENASDFKSLNVQLRPVETLKYCIWILLEILKARRYEKLARIGLMVLVIG